MKHINKLFMFTMIFVLFLTSFIITSANSNHVYADASNNNTTAEESVKRPTSGTCGQNLKWKLSSKGTLTISGSGAMTTYKYDSVGKIAYVPNAEFPDDKTEMAPFFDYDDIKKVVIKKGVTSIGGYAFYGCDGITSVTFPSSGFKKIETNAFRKCTSLAEITIPSSVTSCGSSAFRECTGLKKVKFSGKIKTLNSYTFRDCTALEEITLPSTLTTVGSYSFYKCRALKGINLPAKVKKINKYAFYQCDTIESITLPETVTTIGDYGFSGCGKLKSIYLPQSLTEMGKNCFSQDISLEEISLPEGIKEIKTSTFNNCLSLKNIIIPSTVTSIGSYAFKLCSSLTEIDLPDNLEKISSNAFMNCKGFTTISIPDSVSTISAYAFYCCTNLTDIKLPQTLEVISQYTFCGCTNLNGIVIPESVTQIDSRAFADCTSIKEISIPNGVTTISKYAFEHFTGKILCGRNTAAESYAIENGIEYYIPVNNNHVHEMIDKKIIKESSCTRTGSKSVICSGCGFESVANIPKLEHSKIEDFTAATSGEDGYFLVFCSKCGNIIENKTINKISKITLGKTQRVYNGKVFKPVITVKDSKNTSLVKGTDYTVKLVNQAGKIVNNPINPGKYKYVITFKGNYSGKVNKPFSITPKGTALLKLNSAKKKQLAVKWTKRTAQVNGYQIRYSTTKNFKQGTVTTVIVNKNSITQKTLKNLKSGKTYYVQIRTFKTVNGNKMFSAWSTSKSKKIK